MQGSCANERSAEVKHNSPVQRLHHPEGQRGSPGLAAIRARMRQYDRVSCDKSSKSVRLYEIREFVDIKSTNVR